jgi:hypothetical protein
MDTPTLEDLAQQYVDADITATDLLELAGCLNINLDNIRAIADQHPLIGVVWAQAKGLCGVVEKFLGAS